MKKIFTLAFLLSSLLASALNSPDFTVTRVTSPYFVVDGNSPATGPLTAYVGFKITNTSLTTYNGIKLTISSISTSVVGQNYGLVSPSNGISVIGTLAPGASKICYFYVSYPANVTPTATFNYILSDATAGTKTGTSAVYNRSCISANAGGLATQSINSQDLIGGTVYDDVTYTLGNIKNGDENDFQVSVSTAFDPTKLLLLKTQVISSTVPGITTGTNDQLYFTSTSNQSSGTVTIRWTFKISSYNFTALILPYAGATSGSTNYKYAISTDLGGGTPIVISPTANPLIITKTSDKITYGANNQAIFTVTITNPGLFGISIDKITDQIPTGFSYVGLDATSTVTAANSTSLPIAGATGTVVFEGGVTAGVNTSYTIPALSSIQLKYKATAPGTQAVGLSTTARGYIGITEFGFALNVVNVSTTLPISLVSFNGAADNNHVNLNWTTESENNSSHFIIERKNGNGFTAIGKVNASGNSSTTINYSFTDSFPAVGTNYYRLKMIDRDEKFKYSSVIAISSAINDVVLESAYPNPFKEQLRINLSVPNDQLVQVKLFNKAGVAVFQKEYNCRKGTNEFYIDNANQLATGLYFLQIRADKKLITEKLVKPIQ